MPFILTFTDVLPSHQASLFDDVEMEIDSSLHHNNTVYVYLTSLLIYLVKDVLLTEKRRKTHSNCSQSIFRVSNCDHGILH